MFVLPGLLLQKKLVYPCTCRTEYVRPTLSRSEGQTSETGRYKSPLRVLHMQALRSFDSMNATHANRYYF